MLFCRSIVPVSVNIIKKYFAYYSFYLIRGVGKHALVMLTIF